MVLLKQNRGHRLRRWHVRPPRSHWASKVCHRHVYPGTIECVPCPTSHVTCHISHFTCHMSHFTCHMSHTTLHMLHVSLHMLHVPHHMSHVPLQKSHGTCPMSPATCHRSHVTCHTSHVTLHTSRATRPNKHVSCQKHVTDMCPPPAQRVSARHFVSHANAGPLGLRHICVTTQ